jgi:hypothetical protein
LLQVSKLLVEYIKAKGLRLIYKNTLLLSNHL